MKPLIAIDPCIMEDTLEITLTVGKEYSVFKTDENSIFILDDHNEEHAFDFGHIKNFFKTTI